jgi:poly(3-hydroxybutyrate) depolymerase
MVMHGEADLNVSAPTERVEGSVLCRTWSCGGRPVELRLVLGGGHTWPGPTHRLGTPDAAFDASLAIAEFFRSL